MTAGTAGISATDAGTALVIGAVTASVAGVGSGVSVERRFFQRCNVREGCVGSVILGSATSSRGAVACTAGMTAAMVVTGAAVTGGLTDGIIGCAMGIVAAGTASAAAMASGAGGAGTTDTASVAGVATGSTGGVARVKSIYWAGGAIGFSAG